MKSFVYIYSEHTPRNGHTQKTVRVYQIKRGYPVPVATATDTFVDQFQLVMQALEAEKLLPRRAFERSPTTNCQIYGSRSGLEDAGFCRVAQVR